MKQQDIFIKKAREIHGNRYDYSKVEYVNAKTKVCIICPEHGEFWMITGNHITGKQGCPKCALLNRANKRRKELNIFIAQAKEVHGDKYDYSKVEYVNDRDKVCIICPEHGEFWQSPGKHIRGNGCPKCNGGIKYIQTDFIAKAKEVHGDKYDYSKVEYADAFTKVCIICPEHGEFWQSPGNHLYGNGCPKCVGKNRTTETFIQEAHLLHGTKYNYEKVDYQGIFHKVCIICPEHGEFWQSPHDHLRGHGCIKCKNNRTQKITTLCAENFQEKAVLIHGNRYDYSKVEYVNAKTKVCIICPEHGEFWQSPNGHLNGKGCPKCKESFLEKEVRILLEEKGILFEREKRFEGYNRIYDFYLPKYNIIIECQGIQHFKDVDFFKLTLQEQIKIDKEKHDWCIKHNIVTYYFTHDDFKEYVHYDNEIYTQDNIFFSIDSLLKSIKN